VRGVRRGSGHDFTAFTCGEAAQYFRRRAPINNVGGFWLRAVVAESCVQVVIMSWSGCILTRR
jgi:hypothetical protein